MKSKSKGRAVARVNTKKKLSFKQSTRRARQQPTNRHKAELNLDSEENPDETYSYVYSDDEEYVGRRYSETFNDLEYPSTITVAERRSRAKARMTELAKKGERTSPVILSGRQISKTFWGQRWCDHLEAYHDYENRLPRGRSYVRSGSVIDLVIQPGLIHAKVEGNALYEVSIRVRTLDEENWDRFVDKVAGQITSSLDLLTGQLSEKVISMITDPNSGIFPMPAEVKMACTCPDYATVCKHAAAVLYGVGNRLDTQPELFFTLRSVNHQDLVSKVGQVVVERARSAATEIDADEIKDLFGIEFEDPSLPE